MSAQDLYEQANRELDQATASRQIEDSNNHAVLACALYLRAITEMLGTKFEKEDKSTQEGKRDE